MFTIFSKSPWATRKTPNQAIHPTYIVTNIKNKERILDGNKVPYSLWVRLFKLHVRGYKIHTHNLSWRVLHVSQRSFQAAWRCETPITTNRLILQLIPCFNLSINVKVLGIPTHQQRLQQPSIMNHFLIPRRFTNPLQISNINPKSPTLTTSSLHLDLKISRPTSHLVDRPTLPKQPLQPILRPIMILLVCLPATVLGCFMVGIIASISVFDPNWLGRSLGYISSLFVSAIQPPSTS